MSKKIPQVYTEITINASKEKVWKALLDFQSYPTWNTFITKIEGNSDIGGKVKFRLALPIGFPLELERTICRNTPNKVLAWNGYMVAQRLFEATYIFEMEEKTENEVLFIQREEYKGFMVPFVKFMLPALLKKGFENMNQDLKKIVEIQ